MNNLFKLKYLIGLRTLIIFLLISISISISISQDLDLNSEGIRNQIKFDNDEIDLARVKADEFSISDFNEWKNKFFIFKSSEYYYSKSESFDTRIAAKEDALRELSSYIRVIVSGTTELKQRELISGDHYLYTEDYHFNTSTITHEVIINPSIIYIKNDDSSYSAFILKHKLEYVLDVSKETEKVLELARYYEDSYHNDIKLGLHTNAFKSLCHGYDVLDKSTYSTTEIEKLKQFFNDKLERFIEKVNLNSIYGVNEDKDNILPFTEYTDFITMKFDYNGDALKNFPLILKCTNCLVDDWDENKNTLREKLDDLGRLTVSIDQFLTTSSGQKIIIYPDVDPIDNLDSKFSFKSDLRKKEFNVSDKIVFGKVKINESESIQEPINREKVQKLIVYTCEDNEDKYTYLDNQSQYNGPYRRPDENLLVLALNKKIDRGQAELIYSVSGSEKASAKIEFNLGYFNLHSEQIMEVLIKNLYKNYERNNNFVTVNLNLANTTTLKMLQPYYDSNYEEVTDPIRGSGNKMKIILRRGQEYSFKFYNNSFNEEFWTSVKTFTEREETFLDPLNGNFRFPANTLKIPLRLKGIGDHSLTIYSSENNIPFGGWRLKEIFEQSNDSQREIKVENDKKYKIILLKNGYKEYKIDDLSYFNYNAYKSSNELPFIRVRKSDLKRPDFYDYIKYLSLPGIGQREAIHHSKFNWRKFESYILIASSCYLGWKYSKVYSAYDDSKRNYYDLQSEYSLLRENEIDTDYAISLKEDAGNMYNSMEKNYNDLNSTGNILIGLYLLNFADIVFTMNFIY